MAQVSLEEINIQSPIVDRNLEIILVFSIEKGYCIQSNEPEDEFLIPTIFEIENCEGLDVGEISFLSDERSVGNAYQNQFSVLIQGKLSRDKVTIEGVVEYQACDASKCFFPRKTKVGFGVPVYLLVRDRLEMSNVF